MSTIAVSQTDLLNSWKEIAAYLNRGVRTVQRWEVELSLPVRRPRARNRSAVIAMRSELDQWLKACPVAEHSQPDGQASALPILPPVARLSTLLLQARALQEITERRRQELQTAVFALKTSVTRISGKCNPSPAITNPK